MMRVGIAFALLLALVCPASAQKKKPATERWSPEKANAWYKEQPWPVGCNYIPSTAINQLEMWQADTWDLKTIDRELGWAADLGFTSVRVFLHDLAWQKERNQFINRMDYFLRAADKHRLKVIFVLFDSCWHPEPKAGKQPEPTPHRHNSGWVQSPGVAVLKDHAKWAAMAEYVHEVMRAFQHRKEILCWDLWNEPENNNASSYGDRDLKNKEKVVLPLVKQVFAWARDVNPTQPITAAPWIGDWSDESKLSPLNRFLFDNSDIITFHRYENLEATKKSVESLKRYNRPILCTEFMARPLGSRFETHLPYFHEHKIGAYCWGFVAGKSQTIYPWDSWQKQYTAEPKVWFHDILRSNGKPYDEIEVKKIKDVTNKKVSVRLRFSVDSLDPRKPEKSYAECIIRNGTDKPIVVPSNYSGGWRSDLFIHAHTIYGKESGRAHTLTLVRWADKTDNETKMLKPGEEFSVFKNDLRAVLVLDSDFKYPRLKSSEPRYYWSWMA